MARSDNWRIQKSTLPAIEGAYILKALCKVAGSRGITGNVSFLTAGRVSGASKDNIYIGGAGLFDTTQVPIPPENFDALVGLTLHEVGHIEVNSDGVRAGIGRLGLHSQDDMDKLHDFCNIAEDILIDSQIYKSPLADYIKSSYKWAEKIRVGALNPNDLLSWWVEIALWGNAGAMKDIPQEFIKPLGELLELTKQLRVMTIGSPYDRAKVYYAVWDRIKNHLVWEEPQTPMSGGSGEGGQPDEPQNSQVDTMSTPVPIGDDEQGGDTGGAETPAEPTPEAPAPPTPIETPTSFVDEPMPLTKELLDAIDDALKSGTEDITEAINKDLQESHIQDVGYTTIRKRETQTPLLAPNADLRRQLERVLSLRHSLQKRTLHGEDSGKLDMRHLGRMATDRHIFKQSQHLPDGVPKIAIVVDLSGSMQGDNREEVLEASCALASLTNCQVWGYDESMDVVTLVRLDD